MIEQLAGYFVDFGEEVSFGTSTVTAIVDMPTVEMVDALARDVLITAPDTEVTGVSQGDPVTIRAVTYTVRSVVPEGSGLTSIFVSKP